MTRTPSGRANPLLKPEPHACCPHASHLRVRSFVGTWSWYLLLGGMTLPLTCCPWCGVKLPREGKARIRLVRV